MDNNGLLAYSFTQITRAFLSYSGPEKNSGTKTAGLMGNHLNFDVPPFCARQNRGRQTAREWVYLWPF